MTNMDRTLRDQSRELRAEESTSRTPLTALATAMDFCTCALLATVPDSVTRPFFVVTLMSPDLMPSVVASSLFTLVVIHVSVTGCCDDFALVSVLPAYADATPPHTNASPNAIAHS